MSTVTPGFAGIVFNDSYVKTVCFVAQLCPALGDPMVCSLPGYWSGLSCPPPGDIPNPGIESWSPTMQVDSLPSEPPGKPYVKNILYNLRGLTDQVE